MNCPHCKSSNRADDETCYNCEKPLYLTVDSENETSTHKPQTALPTIKPGRQTPKRVDRSSNLLHGLRSGATAGLAWGIFASAFKTAWGGTFSAGLVANSMPGFLQGMGGYFLATLSFHVIYGLVLGCILAVTQRLCYQKDASWIGALFGGALGILMGDFLTFWYWEAPLGAAAGGFISFVERSWFRKEYSEFMV